MEAAVEMKGISHWFGKVQVIHDVDLSVEKGEIFGLLGPSGSGKTTLVKMMTGLLRPSKGVVQLNGEKMPSLKQLRQFGFMAQSDALYSELTGRENLDFFASLYGMSRKDRHLRMNHVLDMVDLTAYASRPVNTYSGGMKRRLSLAASLIHEPELIILDEPTVGIDPVLRQSIWSELNRLRNHGVTIIVTTHVMDEAEKCGHLALLRDGRMMAEDTPSQLKSKLGVSSIEEVFLHYGGGARA
ncbi:ATP-binding cassette domain-containing protein [Halobacillus litoralis]|uniref:ATP-binding cassette domain-containing protein n=1 Tax=Halobacillus litoralis TaxID=45668 RepID=A0A845DUI3_9BACI|nr:MULTISPECIES: ABC transporter ATP-binding protein [Halobacillus]MYL21311.1 ATP-binding cassette domain-containing protein [Halobacillus litoralis]MYL30245.1 ATP-binding cassette domain-containing protein [Halobacillus halophilus]